MIVNDRFVARLYDGLYTLSYLLPSVHLCDLFFEKLVTSLADGDDLFTGSTELDDAHEHLLRNLSRGLILGEGIRVVQRVIYNEVGQSRDSGRFGKHC
jgi:hypothetical protein